MPARAVTVGMIVRNGAMHIDQAIASFLAQTHTDLRLNVHDNASTDATPEIVERHVRADTRVRLIRSPRDIGAIANLATALDYARTPFFCWAAHDDLRHPEFLADHVALLERHPEASLACSAARAINPAGEVGTIRRDTLSLRTTLGMSPAERLAMYLRQAPALPIYGLFRTESLIPWLPGIRREQRGDLLARFGWDVTFLARFLGEHHIAVTPRPLVLYRSGGVSFALRPQHGPLGAVAVMAGHAARMSRACRVRDTRPRRRALAHVRRRHLASLLAGPMLRRLLLDASTTHGWRWTEPVLTRFDPAMARLRRRAACLVPESRLVVYGGGLHTRRRLAHLKQALGPRGTIIGICDDHADRLEPIDDVPLLLPSEIERLNPDVILVSSDGHEQRLYERALDIAGEPERVWRIYS